MKTHIITHSIELKTALRVVTIVANIMNAPAALILSPTSPQQTEISLLRDSGYYFNSRGEIVINNRNLDLVISIKSIFLPA